MDPKEYAARLERMRRQLEQEKVSNEFNRAMETSPMEDTVGRLYEQYQAVERPKPKAKKQEKKAEGRAEAPAAGQEESDGMRIAREAGFRGKYAAFAPRIPTDPADSGLTPAEWQEYEALEMRGKLPHYMRKPYSPPAPAPRSIADVMRVLPDAVRRSEPVRQAAPTVNVARDTVKPPPAEPSAADRVGNMPADKAEALLQDIYSQRGKRGQYAPDEMALIEALQARAKGFDYSKVTQAPAEPYVPSFMRKP